MSQVSRTAGHEPTSPSTAAGSVSITPEPPLSTLTSPASPALAGRHQPAASRQGLVEDELGPSLTSAQLMKGPRAEQLLPDLSVSNEALLASLRPVAETTLSMQVSRAVRGQSERALYWFGTRPSWLQATLSVVGGSIVGLSLVVGYAKTFHSSPEPELSAEPVGPARGVALAAAAAPAALMAAQSVVQPLAPAQAKADAARARAEAASAAPAAQGAPAATVQDDDEAAAEPEQDDEREPRKHGRRQRASKASSSKLPGWVQHQIKPQVQRAASRERKAALREKRAAALREKKARRSRARARQQE